MNPLLAYFWQRRWRFFLGAILALVGLPLLHPFVRQALFGPTINDIPWCVWEDAIRHRAHPERADGSWLQRTLIKAGLLKEQPPPDAQFDERAIPVLLHLAEDNDPLVRRVALEILNWSWTKDHERERPLFRDHLQDSDSHCRLIAAAAIWRITKDPEMARVALPMARDPDWAIRFSAASLLADIGPKDDDFVEALVTLARDPNDNVRLFGIQAQRKLGKRGVPVLRSEMRDANSPFLFVAIECAGSLGKDGAELVPDLLAFQNNPNHDIRRAAVVALHMMDPERFPMPDKVP